MDMTTAAFSEKPDSTVRVLVQAAIAEHGPKRGMHRVAEMLGVTERWLRGFRYGEPARIDAEVFLRAVEARRVLRAERRARLLRELAELEGDTPHAQMDVAMGDARLRLDGGPLGRR